MSAFEFECQIVNKKYIYDFKADFLYEFTTVNIFSSETKYDMIYYVFVFIIDFVL